MLADQVNVARSAIEWRRAPAVGRLHSQWIGSIAGRDVWMISRKRTVGSRDHGLIYLRKLPLGVPRVFPDTASAKAAAQRGGC